MITRAVKCENGRVLRRANRKSQSIEKHHSNCNHSNCRVGHRSSWTRKWQTAILFNVDAFHYALIITQRSVFLSVWCSSLPSPWRLEWRHCRRHRRRRLGRRRSSRATTGSSTSPKNGRPTVSYATWSPNSDSTPSTTAKSLTAYGSVSWLCRPSIGRTSASTSGPESSERRGASTAKGSVPERARRPVDQALGCRRPDLSRRPSPPPAPPSLRQIVWRSSTSPSNRSSSSRSWRLPSRSSTRTTTLRNSQPDTSTTGSPSLPIQSPVESSYRLPSIPTRVDTECASTSCCRRPTSSCWTPERRQTVASIWDWCSESPSTEKQKTGELIAQQIFPILWLLWKYDFNHEWVLTSRVRTRALRLRHSNRGHKRSSYIRSAVLCRCRCRTVGLYPSAQASILVLPHGLNAAVLMEISTNLMLRTQQRRPYINSVIIINEAKASAGYNALCLVRRVLMFNVKTLSPQHCWWNPRQSKGVLHVQYQQPITVAHYTSSERSASVRS